MRASDQWGMTAVLVAPPHSLHILRPYSTAPSTLGCWLVSLGLCGGLLWAVEVMVQQDGQAQLFTRHIAAAVQHTL